MLFSYKKQAIVNLSSSWKGLGGASGSRWPGEALQALSQRRAPITPLLCAPKMTSPAGSEEVPAAASKDSFPSPQTHPRHPRHPQCPRTPASQRAPGPGLPDLVKVEETQEEKRVKAAKPQHTRSVRGSCRVGGVGEVSEPGLLKLESACKSSGNLVKM